MAEQIIQLPANNYLRGSTTITWNLNPRPRIDSGLVPAGQMRYLARLQIFNTRLVTLNFEPTNNIQTPFSENQDLTPAFEATGTLTLTVGTLSLTVALAGADLTEQYAWMPANAAEITNFYLAVRALPGRQAATLVLNDNVAAAPDAPVAPTVTARTGRTLRATWTEPANNGADITAYAVRYRETGTSTWTTVSNLTARSFTTPALKASTTYEMQVRATNSEGDSDWSPSGSALTHHTVTITTPAQTVDGGANVNLVATTGLAAGSRRSVAWTGQGNFATASALTSRWTAPPKQAQAEAYVLRCTVTDTSGVVAFAEVTITVSAFVQTTDTDTLYGRFTSEPTAPTGGTTAENHQPTGWSRTQPTATTTHDVYRITRTRTYRDGTFHAATSWGSVTLVASSTPIITTDIDYLYRLSRGTPAAPTGGTTVETHAPSPWSRTVPTPTQTESVWRVERTRTFSNGVFTRATVWGGIAQEEGPDTNIPPMVTIMTPRQAIAGGAQLALQATVTDPDSPIVSTGWTGQGTFADATAINTVWTAPPAESTTQAYRLRLTARDRIGAEGFHEVTILVRGTLMGAVARDSPTKPIMWELQTMPFTPRSGGEESQQINRNKKSRINEVALQFSPLVGQESFAASVNGNRAEIDASHLQPVLSGLRGWNEQPDVLLCPLDDQNSRDFVLRGFSYKVTY